VAINNAERRTNAESKERIPQNSNEGEIGSGTVGDASYLGRPPERNEPPCLALSVGQKKKSPLGSALGLLPLGDGPH
jgi:hypothetical protein